MSRSATRALLVTGIACLAGCIGWSPWLGPDDACGAAQPPNRILAQIPLERVAAMGMAAPGLVPIVDHLDPDGRALLVVFEGPLRDTEILGDAVRTPPEDGPRLANVCVVASDGTTRLVPNVDVRPLFP